MTAGKRIVELQYSLARISNPSQSLGQYGEDGRTPFEHQDLIGLASLSAEGKAVDLHHNRLARVGESYGLIEVLRWKPKIVCFHRDMIECH